MTPIGFMLLASGLPLMLSLAAFPFALVRGRRIDPTTFDPYGEQAENLAYEAYHTRMWSEDLEA